jgi:putative transcriptional regulator
MKAMLEIEYILPEDIRFYLGYSGWGKDQLKEELNEKSWILSDLETDIVFNTKTDDELWKTALESLGEPYAEMIHYPINPQLN